MSKNVLQAIAAMHKEFGVIIPKDSKGHKGTYASLPAVLSWISHHGGKYGLTLIQHPNINDGMLSLVTTLVHTPSGEKIDCESILTPTTNNPSPDQAYGSSMTYHRRYDAMAICGLFAEEDPSDHDGWNDHKPQQIQKPAVSASEKASDQQAKRFYAILKGAAKESLIKELTAKYGKFQNMTTEQMDAVLDEEGLN